MPTSTSPAGTKAVKACSSGEPRKAEIVGPTDFGGTLGGVTRVPVFVVSVGVVVGSSGTEGVGGSAVVTFGTSGVTGASSSASGSTVGVVVGSLGVMTGGGLLTGGCVVVVVVGAVVV